MFTKEMSLWAHPKVAFKEGERLRLKIERFDITKFLGAFGKGSSEEFEQFEEEAQV